MIDNFDGEFFQIEFLSSNKWFEITSDHIDTNIDKDFCNTGDCFIQLGLRGTFSRINGINAIINLSKKYPDSKFRLMRRDVSWHSTVIFQN